MLRYAADVKAIVYLLLAFFLLYFLWNYADTLSPLAFAGLYSLQLLLAVSVSVMAHNHQHLSMWLNKWMNVLTDNVLTVLYGFPVFAWIPTHNSNHHVHVNKEPDYTKTYRYSEKNNLLTLLSYPTISGYFQQNPVKEYFFETRRTNKPKFYLHLLQIISLVSWVGIALILDWKKAIYYVIIPQQFSLFAVLIFNYVQHVHADEETKYNSSRNITGWLLNFVLFNNGYHTAHHISPGIHWSKLKEKHEKIAPKIHPSLNEPSFFWYLFRVYILGLFIPSLRTKSMRLKRIAEQQGNQKIYQKV